MARDPDQTRARLLAAATAEFAQFGIAGARVDRIAAVAGANKQLIYAYFGGKDELFDAVFNAHVGTSTALVDFDATDLPGYAGRLFDRFAANPAALRLSIWYRLERPRGPGLQAVVAVNRVRLDRLAEAQRAGVVPDHFDPVTLLSLIQAIATSWESMNLEFGAAAPADRGYRRRAVVDAVRRLIATN